MVELYGGARCRGTGRLEFVRTPRWRVRTLRRLVRTPLGLHGPEGSASAGTTTAGHAGAQGRPGRRGGRGAGEAGAQGRPGRRGGRGAGEDGVTGRTG